MASDLILVVDDDPDSRAILRTILEHAGYDVLLAEEGRTATRMARQHHPDLILMDLQMPGMSGVDAARVLKADETTARIPIMAITASGIGSRAREHGFCGILMKPVFPTEVLQAVEICRRELAAGGDWIELTALLGGVD